MLDLLLPDITGVEVCRRLREWTQVPVLVVSAVDEEEEKIAALDAGRRRLRHQALRRGRAAGPAARGHAPGGGPGRARRPPCASATWRSTWRCARCAAAGEPVHLTPHEYGLLAELARHPDRVLTHRALLSAVWGPGYADETHYLRVYMGNLRRKLEVDPARPRHLVTETGVGYRLRLRGP